MSNHRDANGDLIHTPYRQIFADAAARTGDSTVYSVGDLYKKAIQVDTGAEYVLTAVGPTTWTTAGAAVQPTDYNASTILVADTDDTPVALTVPASTVVGRSESGNISALGSSQLGHVLHSDANAIGFIDDTKIGAQADWVCGASATVHEQANVLTWVGTSNNDITITGIHANPTSADFVWLKLIRNNSTSVTEDMIFDHLSGTAGRQVLCPRDKAFRLMAGEQAWFFYDKTAAVWVVIASETPTQTWAGAGQQMLVSGNAGQPFTLDVPVSTFVGRKASGGVDAMTPTEARTVLNVENGATADQTGAEIKTAYEGESDTKAEKQTLTVEVATLIGSNTYRTVLPGCTVRKIWSVISAGLAVGDATLTASISGTPITTGVITITQSGSAAGDVDSTTPTGDNTATAGQVLELLVGGTNTGAVRADVTVEIDI